MEQTTKEKILTVGAEIIHHKGFNYTGIKEILDAAGVPKGSFYNYFKNKEDFGLHVINYFVAHFEGLAQQMLDDTSSAPLKRIENILNYFIEFFKSTDCTLGCPIGNLSQEMGDLSPAFRKSLRTAMDAMVERYIKVLEEAKGAGEIPGTLDVKETAFFLVSSWQGALVYMKITKSTTPLENHRNFIFDYVLKCR